MTWKQKIKTASTLYKIIAINVIVFVVVNILMLFVDVSVEQVIVSRFSWSGTAFVPALFFRPWSWFTHLVFHTHFWHLFFNMTILYYGGSYFVKTIGESKLLPVYLLGGFMGYLFYVLSFHLFPNLKSAPYIIGASASVIAVLVAAATFRPNTNVRLFNTFDVQFWVIALGLVLYDIASLNAYDNSGGHVAHLGGALFGLLFAVQYKKGKDMSQWLVNLIEKIRIFFEGKGSNTQNSFYEKPFVSDEDFNVNKINAQKRVDQILDKISKSGYSSLTTKEKEYLNEQSKR